MKKESLVAQWLGQASQVHKMFCYDPEVMGLNPCRIKLGTLCLRWSWTKSKTGIELVVSFELVYQQKSIAGGKIELGQITDQICIQLWHECLYV